MEAILDVHIGSALEQYATFVPVEGRKIGVMIYSVALEQQAIDRLGIKQGVVEGVELIVDDTNGIPAPSMEVGFLLVQRRYLGIDGDDGIGKLEHVRERIDKAITANEYIATSTRLIPAIAVATQENCSS